MTTATPPPTAESVSAPGRSPEYSYHADGTKVRSAGGDDPPPSGRHP